MSVFNRSSIIAFANHNMAVAVRPHHGARGWALYPEGFFGDWKPGNSKARRSMMRPKMVTFQAGFGWVFDIEFRILDSKCDRCPVGVVYANQHPESGIPADNIRGAKGYLSTTRQKRVRVVHTL